MINRVIEQKMLVLLMPSTLSTTIVPLSEAQITKLRLKM